MTLRSLAVSWIIALCLLAGVSLWDAPTVSETNLEIIQLPPEQAPTTDAQLTKLQAKVWCALDKKTVAKVQFDGLEHALPGGMAIIPSWEGNRLTPEQSDRLHSCVEKRLQSLLHSNQSNLSGHHPARSFLISNL